MPEPATPPLVRLSEEVGRLGLPQQSDKFVKALRRAVREEEVDAAYVTETFELPKVYRFKKDTPLTSREKKRVVEEGGGYTTRTTEMLILASPAYQAWFDRTAADLAPAARPARSAASTGVRQTTAERLLADTSLTLFRRSLEDTRQRLRRQHTQAGRLATSAGFQSQPEEQPDSSAPAQPGRRRGRAARPKGASL